MNQTKITNEKRLHDIIHNFLINFSFFNVLNKDELTIIANHLNIEEIDQGKILFKEGDKGDCVYFIVDGKLDVLKESVSGKQVGIDKVSITTLSKGNSIGEMSIIDKIHRSATVRAQTKTALVTLTLSGFDSICDDYPKIGIKIIKEISRLLSINMRKTSSRLADYMLAIS